jgi:hypothetical protein
LSCVGCGDVTAAIRETLSTSACRCRFATVAAAGHEPRVLQSSTTRWRAASSMLGASDRHPARLSNMTTLRTKPMTASMDAMPADAMPGANRPADHSFPATDGQTRLADPCDDLCAYCRGPETD